MGGWSEWNMGQRGFFDAERRLEAISAKGDALAKEPRGHPPGVKTVSDRGLQT